MRLNFMIYSKQTNKQTNKTKQIKSIKLSRNFQNLSTKSVDRAKLDTPSTHIHDRSLSWLGTGMSIKSDGVSKIIILSLTSINIAPRHNYNHSLTSINIAPQTNKGNTKITEL